MKHKDHTENVVIIGGGPAGLAASIYTAREELNPLVIAGFPPGGQLIYTREVENYPGYESILGPQLIMKMRDHAKKFNARFVDDIVSEVILESKPFTIKTKKGTYYTKTIIIATGANAKWLGIESEQRLRGKGVSACAVCDGFFYKDKDVAVVGGGDSAMEEALILTNFARKVYIIHRRGEFRASKIMQKRVLAHKKIEVIRNAVVKEVLGVEKVTGVKLDRSEFAKKGSKLPEELSVEGLFIAIGHFPNTMFLQESGIELDELGYIYTNSRYAIDKTSNSQVLPKNYTFNSEFLSETSVEGVFAAGDVVDFRYKQVATAVGMGVSAALEVERYLQRL